jgi:hypothetical protein
MNTKTIGILAVTLSTLGFCTPAVAFDCGITLLPEYASDCKEPYTPSLLWNEHICADEVLPGTTDLDGVFNCDDWMQFTPQEILYEQLDYHYNMYMLKMKELDALHNKDGYNGKW